MRKWHYTYAQLQVRSNLELPEWESFLLSEVPKEVDVSIHVEGCNLAQSVIAPESVVSANEFYFHMPEVGTYRIINGKKITVSPAPGAGQNELRLFLLGSAWGALCYQRGLLAIHAGAVQVGNEAVLFCALPGKGKSTMTAWLAAQGFPLVSDDLCCIDFFENDQPVVFPSTQRFRLWKDALQALGWNSDELERDHYRHDKFLLSWAVKPLLQPLPLRAIYLLEWGEEHKLERLRGINALERFVTAATYRGELLCQMGLSATYWQHCLRLVQRVPLWELQRQKDLKMLVEVSRMLVQHWS